MPNRKFEASVLVYFFSTFPMLTVVSNSFECNNGLRYSQSSSISRGLATIWRMSYDIWHNNWADGDVTIAFGCLSLDRYSVSISRINNWRTLFRLSKKAIYLPHDIPIKPFASHSNRVTTHSIMKFWIDERNEKWKMKTSISIRIHDEDTSRWKKKNVCRTRCLCWLSRREPNMYHVIPSYVLYLK